MVTTKFPLLTYRIVPHFDPATWTLRIFGALENPIQLSYGEVLRLPKSVQTADFHCVTKWTRLDNVWEGVATSELARISRPSDTGRHVLVHCDGGYTTNMPVEVFFDDDVLLTYRHDGADLTPEHGYPLRLIVPKHYDWKSAKWVRALELLVNEQPGFWEVNGYHPDAAPWKEHRFPD